MHLQFFAEDEMDEVNEQDDLDALLDQADADNEEEAEEVEEEAEETEPEVPPAKPDKAAQSFAFMRTQVAEHKQLLNKLAKSLGIEFTDEADLMNKLNDDALTKIAAQQKIPVEYLRRMEALEQDSKTLQQTKMKDAAFIGFQNVMKTYDLTQDELTAFAAELDTLGKNPFLTTVDLDAEYQHAHFEQIVQKRVDKAIAAALSKSNAADKHSTTPSKQKGSGDSTGKTVSTVDELNALLDGM